MSKRAVLFDVDGVLIHGYHTRDELRRKWDAHLFADLGIDRDAFYEAMVRHVLVDEVIPGHRALFSALEEVLPKLGYTGSPMNVMSYWMRRDTQLNLPLLDVIKRLRASGDCDLYIATNQEHVRAFYLWDVLGLGHLFDDIFYASRLGYTKPDRRFFEAVATRLGPQEQPPLFFDDSPPVVETANAFGWEATVVNALPDVATHPWVAARLA